MWAAGDPPRQGPLPQPTKRRPAVAAAARELAAERKRFGYRRLHALLRREKHGDGTPRWLVNHTWVYRLYREEGLAMRRRVRVATDWGRWRAESRIPKLFINAEPGAILTGRQREFCLTWPNQTEVTVEGIHFVQKDSPEKIGEALAAFVRSLRSI